jgi:hypothetical protein
MLLMQRKRLFWLKPINKGEKRDKMKRTIQALAMLIAMTLAVVWIVGCGEDEEGTVAAIASANPPDGSEIAGNQEITITFDNPALDVTVNGVPATGSGKAWKWKGEIPEGAQTLAVAWTNEDESSGSGSISYTVLAADTTAPTLASSDPGDGDKDLDPEALNADGMKLVFDEALKKVTVEVTVEGEALKWTSELSDDKMTANLVMLKGGELSFESEIVIAYTAEDAAGNKVEGEITFTTQAKE